MKRIDFKNKFWEISSRVILYGLIPVAVFFNHPALIQAKETIEYRININQPFFSEIKSKVDNKTKNTIESLIKQDRENKYTEIAGIVALKNDSLEFYVIPTSNEKRAKQIDSYRDNWKAFYDYIIENKKEFIETSGIEEYLINLNIIRLENKGIGEKVKNRLANNLIYAYVNSSNDQTFYTDSDFQNFYFQNLKPKGELIAHFHIHDNGEPVSEQDIIESYNKRMLVIIERNEGFDLVDVIKGNLNKDEFKY